MAQIIEVLATPVVKQTDFGPVTLTHRGWGHTHQPWSNEAPITSYCVLGVLDGAGIFKPYTGTEDYCQIKDQAYITLKASNAQGKKDNTFRTDDVIAYHKTVKGIV